jgi:hypothetical protein
MDPHVSHKYTVAVIALAVTWALVAILFVPILVKDVADHYKDLPKEALMTLKDAFLIIIGFFFGSSLGSWRKDAMRQPGAAAPEASDITPTVDAPSSADTPHKI